MTARRKRLICFSKRSRKKSQSRRPSFRLRAPSSRKRSKRWLTLLTAFKCSSTRNKCFPTSSSVFNRSKARTSRMVRWEEDSNSSYLVRLHKMIATSVKLLASSIPQMSKDWSDLFSEPPKESLLCLMTSLSNKAIRETTKPDLQRACISSCSGMASRWERRSRESVIRSLAIDTSCLPWIRWTQRFKEWVKE